MSHRDDILEKCALWRRWTLAEAAALKAADWDGVARCQKEKVALQPTLAEANALATQEAARSTSSATDLRATLRREMQDLIGLELANQSTLTEQRKIHERLGQELALTKQTLGKVQRSYVIRHSATWQSYS